MSANPVVTNGTVSSDTKFAANVTAIFDHRDKYRAGICINPIYHDGVLAK